MNQLSVNSDQLKRVHVADVQWGEIPLERILPNPEQPRKAYNQRALEELADSIREYGVRQPIQVEMAGEYFIIHGGERRTKAARMAGLRTIPAVIVPPDETAPDDRLVLALVENLQREEMTPVDEALAYQRLRDVYGLTPKEISQRMNKAYTIVTARLQLAKVDPEIHALMQAKQLSTEAKVVKALMDIEDRNVRIGLARELAGKKAAAATVVNACKKVLRLAQLAAKPETQEKGSPAVNMVKSKRESWPEWDALYQIGKVPPWPLVNDTVMATCDSCALRPVASEKTCNSCALVVMVRRLMEAVDGHGR